MITSVTKERYVALLRGINIGSHKKVAMSELKKMLASLKYEQVATLLNSGNAIFETEKTDEKDLEKKIENAFQKKFGFESKIMIRRLSDIKALIDLKPFRNVQLNEDVRLYVTFLREKSANPLKLPYVSPKEFEILSKTDRELFSVLTVKSAQTVDAMAFLEQQYGKDITTRNWNTIEKLAALE